MNQDKAERWTGSTRSRVDVILGRLREYHGAPPRRPPADPLDELIGTVLSQNTSDTNTERSFRSLKQAFPSWESVRLAPTEQVVAAISRGGLANVKGPRIQAILNAVPRLEGQPSLAGLGRLGLEQARRHLMALPGVGPKTAACVLLFALGLPALPVDTHVYRVSRRLGLVAHGVTAEAAHAALESLVSPRDTYDFHMLLIYHGRRVCKARAPACGRCPLASMCPRVGLDQPAEAGSAPLVSRRRRTTGVTNPA
ncbi:MAG: endonuclease III [Chloroflexota bacterium]